MTIKQISAIKHRLSKDFQLAVLSLMGVIALVGITPFLVLRAINGTWEAFVVDLVIECVILGCMLRAWLTGKSHGPSLFLAYFIGVGAVAVIRILGPAGQYWFYPAIVACFFLVHRYHALGITLGGLLAALLLGGVHGELSEIASFAITGIVCAFLAYIFAYRTEIQRHQLETLATKDALTGTYNRHTLIEELERARRIHARNQVSFGILVLDLDHFKQINDSYGHLAGDKVLVSLAQLINTQIRQNDRLFRYGGEEFVILAPDISELALLGMANKLRAFVETQLRNPDGNAITTSIGGSVLRPRESVEQWFQRADNALYVSKDMGRNRVTIDQEEAPAVRTGSED
jgi:diguanylate cyclase (GGDEF)-like protein